MFVYVCIHVCLGLFMFVFMFVCLKRKRNELTCFLSSINPNEKWPKLLDKSSILHSKNILIHVCLFMFYVCIHVCLFMFYVCIHICLFMFVLCFIDLLNSFMHVYFFHSSCDFFHSCLFYSCSCLFLTFVNFNILVFEILSHHFVRI